MKYKLLLALLLIPTISLGFSCPKNKTAESIARDLIEIELSGVRISGQEKSPCLAQQRYKHYVVAFDGANESFQGSTHSVVDSKSLQVISVTLVDPDVYLYKASYTLMAINSKSGKEEKISDSLSFFLYKDSRNQKRYGCAGVTTPPNHMILKNSCRASSP